MRWPRNQLRRQLAEPCPRSVPPTGTRRDGPHPVGARTRIAALAPAPSAGDASSRRSQFTACARAGLLLLADTSTKLSIRCEAVEAADWPDKSRPFPKRERGGRREGGGGGGGGGRRLKRRERIYRFRPRYLSSSPSRRCMACSSAPATICVCAGGPTASGGPPLPGATSAPACATESDLGPLGQFVDRPKKRPQLVALQHRVFGRRDLCGQSPARPRSPATGALPHPALPRPIERQVPHDRIEVAQRMADLRSPAVARGQAQPLPARRPRRWRGRPGTCWRNSTGRRDARCRRLETLTTVPRTGSGNANDSQCAYKHGVARNQLPWFGPVGRGRSFCLRDAGRLSQPAID